MLMMMHRHVHWHLLPHFYVLWHFDRIRFGNGYRIRQWMGNVHTIRNGNLDLNGTNQFDRVGLQLVFADKRAEVDRLNRIAGVEVMVVFESRMLLMLLLGMMITAQVSRLDERRKHDGGEAVKCGKLVHFYSSIEM